MTYPDVPPAIPFPRPGDVIWAYQGGRDAVNVRSFQRGSDVPVLEDGYAVTPDEWVINDGVVCTHPAFVWKIARDGVVIYDNPENALDRTRCDQVRAGDFVRVGGQWNRIVGTAFQWGDDGSIWLSRVDYPTQLRSFEAYWASPVADLILD